jgi:hypothetical protein
MGGQALEHSAAPVLDMVKWVIIAVLLALFVGFVFQISTLTKRVLKRAGSCAGHCCILAAGPPPLFPMVETRRPFGPPNFPLTLSGGPSRIEIP